MQPETLPPSTPQPTLEILDAKLTHLIVVAEVGNKRLERLEARDVTLDATIRALQKLSLRVSSAALQVSAARVAAALVPPIRATAVVAVSAFLGSAFASWAWRALHAVSAVLAAQ